MWPAAYRAAGLKSIVFWTPSARHEPTYREMFSSCLARSRDSAGSSRRERTNASRSSSPGFGPPCRCFRSAPRISSVSSVFGMLTRLARSPSSTVLPEPPQAARRPPSHTTPPNTPPHLSVQVPPVVRTHLPAAYSFPPDQSLDAPTQADVPRVAEATTSS